MPVPPRAVFRSLTKLAEVKLVAAPPLTLMVWLVKSIATCCTNPPEALVMATLVVPEKPLSAVVRSTPLAVPVRVCGAGTDDEALCAALMALTAPETKLLS